MKTSLYCSIATAALVGASHAATITLPSVAETYIRNASGSTNSNFGGDSQVIVGTTNNDRLHGLVRFDLSAIPAGTISITSVELLTKNVSSAGNGSPTLVVYTYGFDFVENSATWNNPDGATGGDASAGGTFGTNLASKSTDNSASGTNTFGSTTAFVTAAQTAFGDDGLFNLILARNPDTSGSNNFTRFDQNEFDLRINYDVVPEPSAALLGAMGALLLLRRRR